MNSQVIIMYAKLMGNSEKNVFDMEAVVYNLAAF
jgi:hypothetical protein